MQVNITLQNNAAISDPATLHTSTSDYAEFHANDANYRITFPTDTPFSVSTFTCAQGADVRQNVRPGAPQKEYKYNLKNLNTGVEVDPKVIIQP